ncbi:MAG TPA: hypothetical protein VMV50_03725 [Candidatus Paceibacterota bacterium]|nr:hypothetical protein [Candidatus Paceibacterota bacterium]
MRALLRAANIAILCLFIAGAASVVWLPADATQTRFVALKYYFGQISLKKLKDAVAVAQEDENRRMQAETYGLPPTATWEEIHGAEKENLRKMWIKILKLPPTATWKQIQDAWKKHIRIEPEKPQPPRKMI